ncbi:MAG TPA: transcription antitermination factor NusB [Terriglobales bacterium]|nr:transcription antitermination factor NusB [Terriglobales bacterium]
MPVSPARAAAFDILLRVERDQAYASELLNSERTAELAPADRALCMEIVMGVLRWRIRVDVGLGEVVSQALTKLDREVLTALRMGAYQIGFLERVPARAAVNESVELVKRARKRSAAPLVNAALRKLAAHPELLQPVLPPGAKTVLDLSQLYSHPLWLVARWAERLGIEAAEKICRYNQQPGGMALRLRDAKAAEELRRAGVELAPGALLASARRLKADARQTAVVLDLVRRRLISIQDEASQLVGLLVGEGTRILDCCAAPGGKTAILAERNPKALIVAAEIHPHRARTMKRLLGVTAPAVAQGGIAGTPIVWPHIVVADAERLPFATRFDRVLVDVPCSGTGTLARNPEIKWRLGAADLACLQQRQSAILRAAMQALAPGGRLVYSTCSLEPEENAAVVEEALRGGGVRLRPCGEELERLSAAGELAWEDLGSLVDGPFLRTVPGVHPCDGFFAAIFATA